jgi:hypothetical protein
MASVSFTTSLFRQTIGGIELKGEQTDPVDWIRDQEFRWIPNHKQGVYVVYAKINEKQEVLYVGETGNRNEGFRGRFYGHAEDGYYHFFQLFAKKIKFYYMPNDTAEDTNKRIFFEKYLILTKKPILNKPLTDKDRDKIEELKSELSEDSYVGTLQQQGLSLEELMERIKKGYF